MSVAQLADCALCTHEGGEVLWRNTQLRIVQIHDEAQYPGLCRVIWNAHICEFSDLALADRDTLMRVVGVVEGSMRTHLLPAKINLASLGNQVPHLHWHLIPRYVDDAHFPNPIWSTPLRAVEPAVLEGRQARAKGLKAGVVAAMISFDN